MTVNCLSQYSGCKCILTFTKKSIAISQASSQTFSPRVNWRRAFRRQTYHMRDINAELNVSFHWFHIFAKIPKSWDDVKPTNLFILVCVVVLQMSTVILCEKVPQQCTAWIWCIMCPIHCELTGKKRSAYKFWFWFFDYVGIFFWCWRALVVPCYPGSYWSSACISSTKPLCKLQTWRNIALPSLRAFIV